MKSNISRLILAVIAISMGLTSCVSIDEKLGGNFIPTDQTWDVFPCEPVPLENITIRKSDHLTGYSTSRITFGSIKDQDFGCSKASSFTLVPLMDTLDFGENHEVLQFHFTASRDTLSTIKDSDLKILQNVYVHPLKKALDSTILYTGQFADKALLNEFVDMDKIISAGIPVYNGGDSLSFDFSKEYAEQVIKGICEWQEMDKEKRDSLQYYLEKVPGIYIEGDDQTTDGGRINMFDLPISASDGYIDGNYAELKIRSTYNGRLTDTLFVFFFGPSEFINEKSTSYPSQYAFNSSNNNVGEAFIQSWEDGDRSEVIIEGGSGLKPVVTALEIKKIVDQLIADQAEKTDIDPSSVVINKATIVLPYNVGTDYEILDRYPEMLSPTVRLESKDGKYITYAGLTDSSIESENQGNINRSLCRYQPDLSHHIQEIVKMKKGEGEDVDKNETDEQFHKRLAKYDIWFLIMHEEIKKEASSSGSSYDDYYNNLMYNSYYNNMMYDPYGYGYGYGGYGYGGYGGYGYGDYYGYNNYYNYYMMAAYANASSSSSTTSSAMELDRDRFYNARLNGPGATSDKPSLKISFSAPKKAE